MNNLNMDGLLTFGDSVGTGGANAVGSIASPTPATGFGGTGVTDEREVERGGGAGGGD